MNATKPVYNFKFAGDYRFVTFQSGMAVNAKFSSSKHPKEGEVISWEAGTMNGRAIVESVTFKDSKAICSIKNRPCRDDLAGSAAHRFA